MTAAYTYAAAEQRAMRELERRGFGVLASPRSPRPDQLAVGRDIHDWPEAFDNRVGDDLLARWHLSLAAWLAYAEGQRGIAEAVRASAAHQRDAAKARALAVADGKITDRRALADAAPLKRRRPQPAKQSVKPKTPPAKKAAKKKATAAPRSVPVARPKPPPEISAGEFSGMDRRTASDLWKSNPIRILLLRCWPGSN